MKTENLILVFALFLFINTTFDGFAQGDTPIPVTTITSDDIIQQIDLSDIQNLYPKQSWGISAGFSWRDRADNSRTTFCVGTDYLFKINDKPDCGAYFGGFAAYHTSSQDELKENIFKFGPKFEYRIPINESRDTQLLAGLKGFYKTGSEENFGFKQDITGYGGSFYSGLNVRINSKWAIGFEFPIASYASLTFKDENSDNETKQNNTSIALNKRNPLMAYSRLRF